MRAVSLDAAVKSTVRGRRQVQAHGTALAASSNGVVYVFNHVKMGVRGGGGDSTSSVPPWGPIAAIGSRYIYRDGHFSYNVGMYTVWGARDVTRRPAVGSERKRRNTPLPLRRSPLGTFRGVSGPG